MQLPVSKDRTITGAFHKNVVLKKLKAHFKRCHHKTGHEYLRLLHGDAHAHKAGIVTKFLESEKVNVLSHPPFSPDLGPCDYLLLSNLNFNLSGKRCKSRNSLESAVYQFLMGVPIQHCNQCFQNWIDRLKRCIHAGGEYFEGQKMVK